MKNRHLKRMLSALVACLTIFGAVTVGIGGDMAVKAAEDELSNVALGKAVIAYSSTTDAPEWGCHSSYLTDGDPVNSWVSGVGRHMDDGNGEEWAIVDLGRVCDIEKVVLDPQGLTNGYNAFPEDYRIDVSLDNEVWTTAVSVTGDTAVSSEENRVHTFAPVAARYVRLFATKLSFSGTAIDGYLIALDEMEVWGKEHVAAAGEAYNVAFDKPIAGYSSSTEVPAWNCASAFLTDGDRIRGWVSEIGRNASADCEEWIAVNLGGAYDIHKVVLVPQQQTDGNTSFPEQYRIEVSRDGQNYTTVATVTDTLGVATDESRTVEFDTVTANYVRFTAVKLVASSSGYIAALDEMEVYGIEHQLADDELYNVALNKPIPACSSSYEEPAWGCSYVYLNDGDSVSSWASGLNRNTTGDAEEWIVIDLEDTFYIEKVKLDPQGLTDNTNSFPEKYRIEVSLDGETYTTVATVTDELGVASEAIREVSFDSTAARFVKFVTVQLSPSPSGYIVALDEMEVWGCKQAPETEAPETEAPETEAPTGSDSETVSGDLFDDEEGSNCFSTFGSASALTLILSFVAAAYASRKKD